MALPKENVAIAKNILQDVAGLSGAYDLFEKDRPFRTGIILVHDQKYDGGWENVFVNIRNITADQLAKWHARKSELKGNSNFINDAGLLDDPEITRLGWF